MNPDNKNLFFDINAEMTSTEISQITDKRHSHVMRDIRKMLCDFNLNKSKYRRSYLDCQNRTQIEYQLPKRLAFYLLMGYGIKYRTLIIDRYLSKETSSDEEIYEMLFGDSYKKNKTLKNNNTKEETPMNNLEIFGPNAELTMSSREIANLTEKRHADVKRDIRNMFSGLEIRALKFEHSYFDNQNKKQTEYLLNREHTYTLMSGYNWKFRSRIVKRWIELEKNQHNLTPSEYLLKQAQFMVHQERELRVVQQKQEVMENKQDIIEIKLKELNPETGF